MAAKPGADAADLRALARLLDLSALHDELVALLGVEVSIITVGSRIGRDPQVLADAVAL